MKPCPNGSYQNRRHPVKIAITFVDGYLGGKNMVHHVEVMSKERLDRYITEAAKTAGYEEGFGVRVVI